MQDIRQKVIKRIIFFVICFEIILFFGLSKGGSSKKKQIYLSSSIRAHDISFAPPAPKKVTQTQIKSEATPPKPSPKPKKESVLETKPKPVPKPQESVTQEKKTESKSTLEIPSSLEMKLSDSVKPSKLPIHSKGYQEELCAYLHSNLKLLREGYVLLAITVNQQGKILNIEVKDASDLQILNNIKEQIAKISLPSLKHEFAGEAQHTFNINFH